MGTKVTSFSTTSSTATASTRRDNSRTHAERAAFVSVAIRRTRAMVMRASPEGLRRTMQFRLLLITAPQFQNARYVCPSAPFFRFRPFAHLRDPPSDAVFSPPWASTLRELIVNGVSELQRRTPRHIFARVSTVFEILGQGTCFLIFSDCVR